MEVTNLDDFRLIPLLYKYIRLKFKPGVRNVLGLDNLGTDQQRMLYFMALTLLLKPVKLNELTSTLIFYMTIVLDNWRTTKLLTHIEEQVYKTRLFGDTYYWLYLSYHSNLLSPILNNHMVRTRILSTKLHIYDITNRVISFKSFNSSRVYKDCYLSGEEPYLIQLQLNSADLRLIKANGYYIGNIKRLQPKIKYNLKPYIIDILRLGVIICGSYVNDMINPTHNYYPTLNNTPEIRDYIYNYLLKLQLRYKYNLDYKPELDPDLIDILDNLAKSYRYREADYLRNMFPNKFVMLDAKLYLRIPVKSNHVDLYFTSNKYEAVFAMFKEYLDETRFESNLGYTSVIIDDILELRLHRNIYQSIDDILTSQIDSDQVIIYGNQVLCTEAYINAVSYGVNVVSPLNLTEDYNIRLIQSRAYGYEPFIPGGIKTWITKSLSNVHTVYTYVHLINLFNKLVSNQDENKNNSLGETIPEVMNVNLLTSDEAKDAYVSHPDLYANYEDNGTVRFQQIHNGTLEPKFEDLIFFVNSVPSNKNYELHLSLATLSYQPRFLNLDYFGNKGYEPTTTPNSSNPNVKTIFEKLLLDYQHYIGNVFGGQRYLSLQEMTQPSSPK